MVELFGGGGLEGAWPRPGTKPLVTILPEGAAFVLAIGYLAIRIGFTAQDTHEPDAFEARN